LIRSVIDYGSEAYNTASIASITAKAKLDVIQAKALRIYAVGGIRTKAHTDKSP